MLVSILGRIGFTATFSASNNVHRGALCDDNKNSGKVGKSYFKTKGEGGFLHFGKKIWLVLELSKPWKHYVSMVKLLSEFFSLEAQ